MIFISLSVFQEVWLSFWFQLLKSFPLYMDLRHCKQFCCQVPVGTVLGCKIASTRCAVGVLSYNVVKARNQAPIPLQNSEFMYPVLTILLREHTLCHIIITKITIY